ncbi:MAG: hypothetical protein HC906_15535 [Bacteroidales bacterium]|nr:hypothetical protein [Bacteroidales bacterium]
MKKLNTVFLLCLMCLGFIVNNAKAYINFTSTPDTTATLNEAYSYQVTVAHDGTDLAFSLLEKPANMTINSSGLISWTPTAQNQSGRVVVKASNSNTPEALQVFYVYVSVGVVCPSGLVSYWNFDETDGNVFIDSYGNNDAIHQGGSDILYDSLGVTGKSQVFNPSSWGDQFMVIPNASPFIWGKTSSFSISFWFKWSGNSHASPHNQIIFGRTDGQKMIVIGLRSWGTAGEAINKRLNFLIMTGTDYAADAIEVSTDGDYVLNTGWHHVVAVYNGSNQSVNLYYDNGSNLGGSSGTAKWAGKDFLVTDTTKKAYIGSVPSLGYDAYDGALDEFTVYNKALSTAEIASLYNKGIAHQQACAQGNYAPVITSIADTTAVEDEAYSCTLQYREIDNGDVVTKSAPTLPSWLTFNATTGVLSGTPTNAQVGDHSVTLRITDGDVIMNQSFTIKVANVNDAPDITSTALTAIDEDQAYTYNVTTTDPDVGDNITLTVQGTLPSWLNFVDNGNGTATLSGTPTNTAVGTDPYRDYNITVRATDSHTAMDEQSFTIRVTNVNDAPVVTGQASVSTDEDVETTITINQINISDPDDTYPTDHSVSVQDGTNYTHVGNTIKPVLNYNGILTVPVVVSDGQANVNYNLSVTVNAVNDAPVITTLDPDDDATEGVAYSYTILATDVDNATLTFAYTKKPSWAQFSANANSGTLFGTPENGSAPKDTVILTVSDGVATVQQQYVITVDGVMMRLYLHQLL